MDPGDEGATGRPSPALSRREVLLRGVALGAFVWAAPAIAKLPAASGAAGSLPPDIQPTTVIFDLPGTYTYGPPGAGSITVEAWGAGGHGALQAGNQGGGGGGGGGYASSVMQKVEAGTTYTVTVGAPGEVTVDGAASFVENGVVLVRAEGGANATGRDGAPGGNGAQGDIRFPGGNGGRGGGNSGGGGGAAAGPFGAGAGGADGMGGTGLWGGAGGVGHDASGSGGNGGDRNDGGQVGRAAGGAGGGAGRGGETFGPGAGGQVRISWTPTVTA